MLPWKVSRGFLVGDQPVLMPGALIVWCVFVPVADQVFQSCFPFPGADLAPSWLLSSGAAVLILFQCCSSIVSWRCPGADLALSWCSCSGADALILFQCCFLLVVWCGFPGAASYVLALFLCSAVLVPVLLCLFLCCCFGVVPVCSVLLLLLVFCADLVCCCCGTLSNFIVPDYSLLYYP